MGTPKLRAGALVLAFLVGSSSTAPLFAQQAPTVQVDSGETNGSHSPPVEAPIIDPFRAPEHRFGPGNRGLEYNTAPGQPVHASAAGVVSFAGQVGGNVFVSVDHGDGLVTTVGFVDETLVQTGANIGKGELIAIAGVAIHFSARRHGEYFDPELLFTDFRVDFRVAVRLVPGP